MKVYCEVKCIQYNLFKGDVNAVVDFGIADKAENADGWIYNTKTYKKMSFASPMSVFADMAKKIKKLGISFLQKKCRLIARPKILLEI